MKPKYTCPEHNVLHTFGCPRCEDERTNECASSPQEPVVPQRRIEDVEQSGVVVQGDKESTDRKAVDVPQSVRKPVALCRDCHHCFIQPKWMEAQPKCERCGSSYLKLGTATFSTAPNMK